MQKCYLMTHANIPFLKRSYAYIIPPGFAPTIVFAHYGTVCV